MLKFAEYSLIDPLQEQSRATSDHCVWWQGGQGRAGEQLCNSQLPSLPHLSRSLLSAKYSYKAGTEHRLWDSEIDQQLANAGENHKPTPSANDVALELSLLFNDKIFL